MKPARLFLLACCLLPLTAGGQVVVSGAVNRPGAYDLQTAPSVSRLLEAAGGPSQQAGELATLRLADSPAVALAINLRGVRAEPDTALTDGDRLLVSISGAETSVIGVQVDGFVQRPGAYPLPLGARLGDLVQATGGLLPLANPRAHLIRAGRTSRVDLAAASRGEAPADQPLQDGDRLEVTSNAAILASQEARITISGEVRRPGIYPRHQEMRVSDLLRAAGGLNLGADRDRIWLERLTGEGRVRRIPLAPLQAFAGDETQDLGLENRDVVRVPGLEALRPGAEPVTISGEVYYPGSYQLEERQTVGDLLRLASGCTPGAWQTRALLTRRASQGRTRQVAIDLTREPLALPLEPGDLLEVLSIRQAVYAEPTVTIRGDVRYAGRYERTLGMRLSDLVWIAGGVTRNIAFVSCEVARPRDTEAAILRPDLELALAQDPRHDVELRDGDTVYVTTVGEYRHGVREVQILGRVKVPGTYALRGEQESLHELLVERVGGLLDHPDVRGAMLFRRVDEMVHPNVVRYVREIYTGLIEQRVREIYLRGSTGAFAANPAALNESVNRWLDALTGDLAVALPGSTQKLILPRDAELLADRERLAGVFASEVTTPVTESPDQESSATYLRVPIDLAAILAGEQDLAMRPDDVMIVGRQPRTVMIMGEVLDQQALLHMPGAALGEYLKLCGGPTRDGDLQSLLRLDSFGLAEPVSLNTTLNAGDVVLVLPERYFDLIQPEPDLDTVRRFGRLFFGLTTYVLSIMK